MYSALLRAAIADGALESGHNTEELARHLRAQRRALGLGTRASAGGDTMERLTDYLAHDLLLIELCQRLGIEEHLTDAQAGPSGVERDRLLDFLHEKGVRADEWTAPTGTHSRD
jgi:hypothetical protein